jgi:hypothetical protein
LAALAVLPDFVALQDCAGSSGFAASHRFAVSAALVSPALFALAASAVSPWLPPVFHADPLLS